MHIATDNPSVNVAAVPIPAGSTRIPKTDGAEPKPLYPDKTAMHSEKMHGAQLGGMPLNRW